MPFAWIVLSREVGDLQVVLFACGEVKNPTLPRIPHYKLAICNPTLPTIHPTSVQIPDVS